MTVNQRDLAQTVLSVIFLGLLIGLSLWVLVVDNTNQVFSLLPNEKQAEPSPTVVSPNILKPDKDGQVSFTGLVFAPDGRRLYLSNVNGSLKVFTVEADGKVIYNVLDDTTVAVDAVTGKLVWRAKLGDPTNGETLTGAPIVVNGKAWPNLMVDRGIYRFRIVQASQLKSGAPTYGQMYELYAIAAVVVGGTSLSGGEGRVLGTLIGALIIAVIQNGMNLTGVESYQQKIVLGLVKKGFSLDSMETLKKVPRGFEPDHPRAELLKRKGLIVMFPKLEPAELVSRTGCRPALSMTFARSKIAVGTFSRMRLRTTQAPMQPSAPVTRNRSPLTGFLSFLPRSQWAARAEGGISTS